MTAAPAQHDSKLDVGPVNVTGRIRGRRSRVLWIDEVLYVVQAANNIRSFPVPEAPSYTDGVWHAVIGGDGLDAGHHIEFTRKGCPTCGYTLNKLNVSRIVDVAEGRLKRATHHV